MKTHTEVYTEQKAGNERFDNQDAYAIPPTAEGYCDLDEQRFAISDGATEAMFSGVWATILTQAWVENRLSLDEFAPESLVHLAETWRNALPDTPQPWWAEEKLHSGSFATIAGLSLSSSIGGVSRWVFAAIGDSCLFIVRENRLLFAGPLAHSSQFSSNPFLVGSEKAYNEGLLEHLYVRTGDLQPGDELLLATDALACCLLRKFEEGHSPAGILRFQLSEDRPLEFSRFIEGARNGGEMRNDDVTLVSIQIQQ